MAQNAIIQRRERKEVEYNWEEAPESLPEGWKLGTQVDGTKRLFCPDGTIHQNRRRALSYMAAKKFPEQNINRMRSCLGAEGWKEDDKLPSGWMIR